MPRSMFYNANLTASTKTANILSGDVNEFVPYDATVTVYSVSSAIGVKISFFADSDLLIDDKEIPYIGTTLDTSAHFVDQFSVNAGTRLALYLRETAASATTDVYTAVDIQPE
jgi:hypothetical protein